MENQEHNDGQLKIELTPEVAEGIYANLAIITHSSAEVVLDFIRVLPGVPKANVKSRIVLAPEHAKRLLFALQDNVMKYEKAFGPINLPGAEQPQGGRTATPFGVPEGTASAPFPRAQPSALQAVLFHRRSTCSSLHHKDSGN